MFIPLGNEKYEALKNPAVDKNIIFLLRDTYHISFIHDAVDCNHRCPYSDGGTGIPHFDENGEYAICDGLCGYICDCREEKFKSVDRSYISLCERGEVDMFILLKKDQDIRENYIKNYWHDSKEYCKEVLGPGFEIAYNNNNKPLISFFEKMFLSCGKIQHKCSICKKNCYTYFKCFGCEN